MEVDGVIELINKYGFPIVAAGGMGYFIYFIWKFVTEHIEKQLGESLGVLIGLIDRIRMLDNDLIRLNQKLSIVVEMQERRLLHEENDTNVIINKRK